MSMYIYASLPRSYGAFNQIRKDNYPFNRLFPKYLKTLVKLGRNNEMDIFSLLGYVENELFEEDKLPDLPASKETLNFRFAIEDEFIEEYYREQDLTNKMITQMIIRSTIRLSEVYGTSLSRLGALITSIDDEEDRNQSLPNIKERVRIKETQKPTTTKNTNHAPVEEPIPEQVEEELDEEEGFDGEDASRSELLKKIDELTKKSSELVARAERRDAIELEELTALDDSDEPDDSIDSEDKVVETNPYLKDFL